jgi:hypothetical protein
MENEHLETIGGDTVFCCKADPFGVGVPVDLGEDAFYLYIWKKDERAPTAAVLTKSMINELVERLKEMT